MNDVLKQGELTKSPPNGRNIFGRLKHWRKRYFVLNSSQLSYYENCKAYNRGDKALGFIDINECTDVALGPDSLRTDHFVVVLRTKEQGRHNGRVFELSAENQITQKDWLDVLEKCIKQPVELSDDEDPTLAENAPSIYQSSSLTPLQKSIEDAKVRSSNGNRNSQSSSGYSSYGRYSACSHSSDFSDIWGDESDENQVSFSAHFEGPRCKTNFTAIIRAQSMGNLLESSDCSKNSEPRRPSLQERVDMLLSLSDGRRETSMSYSFEEPIYENIPFWNASGVNETCCRCEEQRMDLHSGPRRPRLSSEPLGRRLSFEMNEGCIRRNQSWGTSISSKFMDGVNHGQSRLSENEPNRTPNQSAPPLLPRRPQLSRRQCSKIEEKPEDAIQQRSHSDPTGLRQKKHAVAAQTYF